MLDLETLDPDRRPFIRIDGERYDLAVPGDFDLVAYNRIDRRTNRIDEIQVDGETGVLSDEDAAELGQMLEDVTAEVCRAPAEVLAKLNDRQRLAIIQTFGSASRQASGPTKRETTPNRATRRRTGARSSPDSRASTQASAAG